MKGRCPKDGGDVPPEKPPLPLGGGGGGTKKNPASFETGLASSGNWTRTSVRPRRIGARAPKISRIKNSPSLGSLLCSGNWTRTSDLRVMSPTSYLLLYPAIWTANIQPFFRFARESLYNLTETHKVSFKSKLDSIFNRCQTTTEKSSRP